MAEEKHEKSVGRPSDYTIELAKEICLLMSEGMSIVDICKQEHMPSRTSVYKWILEHKEFADMYTHARDLQAEFYASEVLRVSAGAKDQAYGEVGTGEASARVQGVKLHVDSLKWVAARLSPRKYGKTVMNEHTGAEGGPIKTEKTLEITPEVEERLKTLREATKDMEKPEGLK